MFRRLSPKDLAESLGVSESSVKRWVDEGRLPSARTPKGHRRIDVDDALRFIRETRLPVERPDLLGLPTARLDAPSSPAEATSRLHAALVEGRADAVMTLTVAHFLSGASLAAFVDGPLHEAMERVGELWHDGQEGIFLEHRATNLCLDALREVSRLIEVPANAPLALTATPPGDRSTLPTAALACVLAGEGFRAVNLGAETPTGALLSAIQWHAPRLVCLSITHAENRKQLSSDLERLASKLLSRGAHLAVGGREHHLLRLPSLPNVFHSDRMGDLTGYARGILAAAPRAEP